MAEVIDVVSEEVERLTGEAGLLIMKAVDVRFGSQRRIAIECKSNAKRLTQAELTMIERGLDPKRRIVLDGGEACHINFLVTELVFGSNGISSDTQHLIDVFLKSMAVGRPCGPRG